MSDTIYVDENGNPVDFGISGAGYLPQTQTRSDKADLLEKIRPDLIVEVMRQKLQGKEFINGQWVKNTSIKTYLTDEGATQIANLILSISSQNVSISKLSDDEIKKRLLEVCITAQKMAINNWKEYGIKSTDQLEFIHQIIYSIGLVTLKQPEGAGIRALIMGTTQESRSVVQSEPNRKSWLSWGRK